MLRPSSPRLGKFRGTQRATVAHLGKGLGILLVVDLSRVAGQQEAVLLRRPNAVLHMHEYRTACQLPNCLPHIQSEHLVVTVIVTASDPWTLHLIQQPQYL